MQLNNLLEIAARSAVVYLVLLLAFRLAGKRHISQLSIIDFALILLVSNAVQNAMVGNDSTLLGGIVAALTLILFNVLLSKLTERNKKFGKLFQGTPTLLVRNGMPIEAHMDREDISLDDLKEAMREHGIED